MTEPRLFAALEITEENAQELLAPYGLQVDGVSMMPGGLINTNVRVDCADGSYLLRVYNEERTEGEVEFELSVLEELAGKGFPCQQPLIAEGHRSREWQGRRYSVLTFIEGYVPDNSILSPEVSREIGQQLAQMQHALDGYVPEGTKERADIEFIDGLIEDTVKTLEAGGWSDEAADVAAQWQSARMPFLADALPQGVVHADIYSGNTVFRDGEFIALIDFDDAYFGTLLFDVAITAMSYSFRSAVDFDISLAKAFLDGYEQGQPSVDRRLLMDAMWVNFFRFYAYTLPLTLGQGEAPGANVHAQRITHFAAPELRARIAEQLV